MFLECFSENAIKVTQRVQERSSHLADPIVPGTGHLLLALMEDDRGFAARILDRYGLSYSHIRQVEKLVEAKTLPGDPTDTWIVHRFTELEDALHMSYFYAYALGSREVDTEHLLMGLFHKTEPAAGGPRLYLDADIDRLGAKIIRQFGIVPAKIDQEARKLTPTVKRLLAYYVH